jgi:soluble lytic murein transglycosylase
LFILLLLLSYKPILRSIYPIHYMDLIKTHSEANMLDPYLIAAIISVESSYKPSAVSPKGAIGLMQIMPNTGTWAAKQIGLDKFETDRLFEPEINITIGVWYFTRLLREFDSSVPIALASYNGGETNVRQWLTNGTWSGSIDDIEHIPFPETRKYVQKVLAMYNYYKWLY